MNKINTIIQVWPNVIKMLKYRGYDITSLPTEIDKSYPLAKQKNQIRCKHATTGKEIFVVFYNESKTGVKFVRTLLERMNENQIQDAIIISDEGATAFTLKEIQNYGPGYTIEIFKYEDLCFCLMEHELNKGYFAVNEENKKKMLQILQIKENALPKISKDIDPVAKYLGLNKNDVIGFIRNNGSAPYHRICE